MSGISVSEETFEREVLASDVPVIVDFWAPWCGPCLAISPVLDQIAAERAGELKLVKVDVDEEPGLAVRFGISSIPTIVLFEGGIAVAGTVGSMRKTQLERALRLPDREAESEEPRIGRFRRLLSRLASGPYRAAGQSRLNLILRSPGRTGLTTRTDSLDAAQGIRDLEVVTWRRRQLLGAGFDLRASESLARDCGVDLHALLDLVERGCPPRLAVRILAPLEGESRRC